MDINTRLSSIENSLKQYLNIHGLSIYILLKLLALSIQQKLV